MVTFEMAASTGFRTVWIYEGRHSSALMDPPVSQHPPFGWKATDVDEGIVTVDDLKVHLVRNKLLGTAKFTLTV